MVALYLNVFVLVVQLFTRTPALAQLAPTPQEFPFVVMVLALFVYLGRAALRGFRTTAEQPQSPPSGQHRCTSAAGLRALRVR